MKKRILIFATMGMSFAGMAQDKFVTSANMAMNSKNFDEAKEDIDKAMANPETKEKPKALFTKAQVYMALQTSEKYKASNPYRESAQATLKLIEVKPDYEKSVVDQLLIAQAYQYYNDGINANKNKNYAEAGEFMKMVARIHDIGGGKRFEKSERAKQFDTVAAEAALIVATGSYYNNKYDEAIPLLLAAKNNPITRIPTVYECLIDAYNRQKSTTEANNMIAEARKFFPDDVTLRNYELNAYISSGKQDEMVKKLEEAVSKDPQNGDLLFNLATAYMTSANPKDGKKPANAADFITKAEQTYLKAIGITPENPVYNYNLGALYFNQATEMNDQMNAITGSSDAEQKKYDDLKAKRDAMFGKSMPYFEKSYNVLSTKKGDDMKTYKSTLLALKEVYARQNMMDKANDMKKKYEEAGK